MTDAEAKAVRSDFDKLSYDPSTGVFVWLASPNKRIHAGSIAGSNTGHGYWRVRIMGETYLAHRLAWFFVHGAFPSMHIDHINGNPMDNRIENLRDVSIQTNSQNKRKAFSSNKSSGLLGVSYNKDRSRWVASIWLNGKQRYLGSFSAPEIAHDAYVNAKRAIHNGCTI